MAASNRNSKVASILRLVEKISQVKHRSTTEKEILRKVQQIHKTWNDYQIRNCVRQSVAGDHRLAINDVDCRQIGKSNSTPWSVKPKSTRCQLSKTVDKSSKSGLFKSSARPPQAVGMTKTKTIRRHRQGDSEWKNKTITTTSIGKLKTDHGVKENKIRTFAAEVPKNAHDTRLRIFRIEKENVGAEAPKPPRNVKEGTPGTKREKFCVKAHKTTHKVKEGKSRIKEENVGAKVPNPPRNVKERNTRRKKEKFSAKGLKSAHEIKASKYRIKKENFGSIVLKPPCNTKERKTRMTKGEFCAKVQKTTHKVKERKSRTKKDTSASKVLKPAYEVKYKINRTRNETSAAQVPSHGCVGSEPTAPSERSFAKICRDALYKLIVLPFIDPNAEMEQP